MTAPSVSSNRRRIIPAVLLAIVVALGIAVWFLFLRDDSPDAFDISDATSGITTTSGDDAPADDGTIDGDWSVDPDAGSEAGGTSAGFRVNEELSSLGAITAVGRTEGVNGGLTIAGTTVSNVEITVDLASLQTDDGNRDNRMRSALATDEFPTATFVTTSPIELGAIPAEGETISVTAVGDLTIKGVTKSVEIALDAQLVNGTLVVVGSTPVVFADYGVETPRAAIVVSIEDEGTIEFQLFFTKS